MSRCKVTFLPADVTADVDTDAPIEGAGTPGTLLNIALANGLEIEHPCDGEGTCGLCHVLIESGLEDLAPPPTAEEQDALEQNSPEPKRARLACQAVPTGDVVCRIP